MASTFHLGAYHELADTFTLGFEERKKKRKKGRILSFSMNFLLSFYCHLPTEKEM